MSRVWCGRDKHAAAIDWDFVVVWVTPKKNRFAPKTKLLFQFPAAASDTIPLQSSVRCIEQWTYHRGDECLRRFNETEHEFMRAKQLACQLVATFRRNYLEKHQVPPATELLTGGARYGREQNEVTVHERNKRAPNRTCPRPHDDPRQKSLF